jgi:hypothetical protein
LVLALCARRAELKSLAHTNDDEHNWWLEGHIYNRIHENMQRSHPDWFKVDEPDKPNAPDDGALMTEEIALQDVDNERTSRQQRKQWLLIAVAFVLGWLFGRLLRC